MSSITFRIFSSFQASGVGEGFYLHGLSFLHFYLNLLAQPSCGSPARASTQNRGRIGSQKWTADLAFPGSNNMWRSRDGNSRSNSTSTTVDSREAFLMHSELNGLVRRRSPSSLSYPSRKLIALDSPWLNMKVNGKKLFTTSTLGKRRFLTLGHCLNWLIRNWAETERHPTIGPSDRL